MANINKDEQQIKEIINHYFEGTYQGDKARLKRAFHPDAHITGNIKDQNFDWRLPDFISRVTSKPTAENKGEKYDKEIIFIDQTNHAAMVKARVNVGDLTFIDYITLLKINGQWIIRNKSFTA